MKNVLFGVWLLAAAAAFSSARAETMVLQWDGPTADYQGTYLSSAGPLDFNQGWNTSISGDPNVNTSNWGIGMLTFNDYGSLGVGQIPSGNVVNSALLTLNLRALTIHPSYTGTPLLFVAPITQSFAGSDSNAYLGTTAPDFDAGKAVSFDLTGLTGGDTTFITIDITSIVQSWYDNPLTNFGLALYTADNLNNNYLLSASFRSANGGYSGASSPMLTIDFSVIPEPSVGALLLGGGVLLAGLRYWRKRA